MSNMTIKQRIESLIEVFNELSQIPPNVFVSACTVIINNNNATIWDADKEVWKNNVNSIISEYWSHVYDLYEEREWAWLSSQDFSNLVYQELNTLSYFN